MKKIACLISFLMVQGACFSAFGMDEEDFLTSRPPSPRAAASVDQEERGHRFTQFKESVEALNKKNSECVAYLKLQTAQMFLRIHDPESLDLQKDIETASHKELESILNNLNLLQQSIETLLEMGADHYQANSPALEQKLEEMRQTYFERILQVTEIQKGDILSTLAAQKETLMLQRKELSDQDQKIRDLKEQLLRATQDTLATERRAAAAAAGVRPQVAAATGGEAAAGSLALVVQQPALDLFETFQHQRTPSVDQRFEFVGTCFLQTDPLSPFHMDLFLMSHGSNRRHLVTFCQNQGATFPVYNFPGVIGNEFEVDKKLTERILCILQNAQVAMSTPFGKVFKDEKTPEEVRCLKVVIDFYNVMFSQRFVFLGEFEKVMLNSKAPSFGKTIFFNGLSGDASGLENLEIDEMATMFLNLQLLLSDLSPSLLEFTAPLDMRCHWDQSLADIEKKIDSSYRDRCPEVRSMISKLREDVRKKSHPSLPETPSVSNYLQGLLNALREKNSLKRGNLGNFFKQSSS